MEVGIDVAEGEGSSSSTVLSLPIYGLYKLCNFLVLLLQLDCLMYINLYSNKTRLFTQTINFDVRWVCVCVCVTGREIERDLHFNILNLVSHFYKFLHHH